MKKNKRNQSYSNSIIMRLGHSHWSLEFGNEREKIITIKEFGRAEIGWDCETKYGFDRPAIL